MRVLPSSLPAAVIVIVILVLSGCPKRVEEPKPRSGPPQPFALLTETFERETSQIEERRADIEVDTRDFDRTPHVVASGETPLIRLEGARAKLSGDAELTEGWTVDNFVLLEVLDERGKVIGRANAGFAQGVTIGAEHIDNVGKMSFAFEPGEVDITHMLPESAPFKVRATALDIGGVGRVSNLYLVLVYGGRASGEEDLRHQ